MKHCSLSCGFPNFVPLDNNIPINEPPSAELLPFKMVFPSFFHIEFNSVFSIFNIKKAFLILKLATFLRAEKVGAKFLQLLPAIGLKNYWEHRSKLKLFFLSQKNNLPRSISGQWTMKVIITINLKCLPSFFFFFSFFFSFFLPQTSSSPNLDAASLCKSVRRHFSKCNIIAEYSLSICVRQ